MRHWKPIFIENSRIPVWLSYLAPINISAITLGPIVICRGEMSEVLKRHETIHYQQYLETAFIGFIIIYLYDYIKNYAKTRNGRKSYLLIRAEIEAYENHLTEDYLDKRKRYAWLKQYEYNSEKMKRIT